MMDPKLEEEIRSRVDIIIQDFESFIAARKKEMADIYNKTALDKKIETYFCSVMAHKIPAFFKEKGVFVDKILGDFRIEISEPVKLIKHVIMAINYTEKDENGRTVRVLKNTEIESLREILKSTITENQTTLYECLRNIDLYLDNSGTSKELSQEGINAIRSLRRLQWEIEGICNPDKPTDNANKKSNNNIKRERKVVPEAKSDEAGHKPDENTLKEDLLQF